MTGSITEDTDMRLSDTDLAMTVAIMEDEWNTIGRTTGILTEDDMRRSLQRARYAGKPVINPVMSDTYVRMTCILLGDTEVAGYNC